MKPNPIQQRAIDSTADQNLLISAGAGSGKTATLTTKIYEMINRGEFTPDQLLVLTFTNNAAHEMKERCSLVIFKPSIHSVNTLSKPTRKN